MMERSAIPFMIPEHMRFPEQLIDRRPLESDWFTGAAAGADITTGHVFFWYRGACET
jgi:hypothetical protein